MTINLVECICILIICVPDDSSIISLSIPFSSVIHSRPCREFLHFMLAFIACACLPPNSMCGVVVLSSLLRDCSHWISLCIRRRRSSSNSAASSGLFVQTIVWDGYMRRYKYCCKTCLRSLPYTSQFSQQNMLTTREKSMLIWACCVNNV
jgi:hypothetical protein